MSTVLLEASLRTDMGKGASRRLRRLENKIPAIIYGGDSEPMPIFLLHNKVVKALETESIYSSIFDIMIDGKPEQVILKSIQRHPYKTLIMHMDLQRVSDKDILVKSVPIHFLNEDQSVGVKAGGIINHNMTAVEIRCQANQLPEFIEVDLKNIGLNDVVHLSNLNLPKGVSLSVDLNNVEHDLPIASIHTPRSHADTDSEIDSEESTE